MRVVQDLTPGNASPDMANLRLCKESELRRGQIIGSGAFGTVYKVQCMLLVSSGTAAQEDPRVRTVVVVNA